MLKHSLNTPPGFAKTTGPKGRIFYKILYPIYPWLCNLHRAKINSLGNPTFLNQFQCVKPHLRRRFILKLDLHDAYNTVTAFAANRYADIYFEEHEEFFFHGNGGLIQGAPASSIIFHLYCTEMLDPIIHYYCKQHHLLVTRFVDDILISSFNPITKATQRELENIIYKSGLTPNYKKKKYVDNKFQSIDFVGMRIFNHKVRPDDKFLAKLHRTNPEHKSYEGRIRWEQNVLALNR